MRQSWYESSFESVIVAVVLMHPETGIIYDYLTHADLPASYDGSITGVAELHAQADLLQGKEC